MPSYYNPYNFYPVQYANQMGYSALPMQQPVVQQSQASVPFRSMEWVEGEVGAKAFQMPQGWPANQPIPLWDSTDTVIWLKSWGPMGIPNPMQKLKYAMPEQQNQSYLMSGMSEANQNMSGNNQHEDMSNFATKDDIAILRDEVRQIAQRNASRNVAQERNNSSGNQNGSNMNTQNRGGNA